MRCAAACSSRDQVTSACETIRCLRCDDVIGVYEPMVVLLDGGGHVTSGAAANRRIAPHAPRLHAACFALLDRSPEETLQGSPPGEAAVLDGS